MTQEDYRFQLKLIETEASKKKTEVMIQYAKDLIEFKIGDIIRNNSHIIKIEVIGTYKGIQEFSEPVYKGPVLTAALVPRKDKEIGAIYGSSKDIKLLKTIDNRRIRTK